METTMAEENKSHRASAAADAQNKFESSKMHARKAAEDLREAAGAIAGEYRGKAEQAWTEARGKAEQAWTDTCADVSGRCRRVRPRESNQGNLYRARRGICSWANLSALIAIC